MKIGILTQPLTINYGGILQNYAIQQVLRKLGHEPITIRIAHGWQNMTTLQFLKVYPKYIAFHIIQRLKGKESHIPESIWKWKKKSAGLESFISNHIVSTTYVRGKELNMDIIRQYNIEALLVGSDQVWHGGLPYMTNVYFCGFAKNSEIKRLSYAASFGFDVWRGTEEQTKEAKVLIQQFAAIGVREEKGVDLCKQVLDRNDAKWVLDPTMLLDKQDYSFLCDSIPVRSNRFIFAYILDITPEKKQLIESLAKKYNCEIEYLGVTKTKSNDSIENWLSMFRDAFFVITDSYHGSVFSLIFQKEFLSMYNTDRGNSRMDSLKRITGLDERFIMEPRMEINTFIDYSIVTKKIEVMREQSTSFLINALNK